LSCIEEDTQFKYGRFGQQGGSGWNEFRVRGGAGFGEDGGSMKFRWMRGSVRDEQIRSKGNTKEETTE